MTRLAASLADGDRVTARRTAHTLKGAGAGLGAEMEAINRELAVLAAALRPTVPDSAASGSGSAQDMV